MFTCVQCVCVCGCERENQLVSHVLWGEVWGLPVTLHAKNANSMDVKMHFHSYSEWVWLLPWWHTTPSRFLRHCIRWRSFSLLGLALHGDCDGFTFSWFESAVSQMVSNIVGMLVVAQQAVLWIAERACGDFSSTFIGLRVQGDCGLLYISIDKPCGERQPVSLTGKDRQQPVLLLVSKHLSDILPETQREAVFIRAWPKDWCSERLYCGPVLPNKPQVVAEEGQNTDAEHGRHKKEKQDMEFGVSVWQLICPELYEILQHGGCNEQTVHQRVGQEEDEELVVGESNTVVHPGTMVVHL